MTKYHQCCYHWVEGREECCQCDEVLFNDPYLKIDGKSRKILGIQEYTGPDVYLVTVEPEET